MATGRFLRFKAAWLSLLALSCLTILGVAEACSVFRLTAGPETVVGRNLDWPFALPAYVIYAPRGAKNSALPWHGDWPTTATRPAALNWVSLHASLTFTRWGRGFIESGINEAGLVVTQANLFANYPDSGGRAGISATQWMQYLLDRFGTVDEAVGSLGDVTLDGEGWHFLLADRHGACAVIEYPNGAPLVHEIDDDGVCAMTNTGYSQASSHIPLDTAFGGTVDIAANDDSYGRFVRMAIALREFDPKIETSATDHAFKTLLAVRADDTQRSVVFDPWRGRVSWAGPDPASVRWLDFSTLSRLQTSDPLGVPADLEAAGDVSGQMRAFTEIENHALVSRAVQAALADPGAKSMLHERGLDAVQVVHLISGSR